MDDQPPSPCVVLIVDDEALVRMNGAVILEDAGYVVIEAANADEAVAAIEQAPDVRLLFSDVDMPGSMDGVQLVKLVHRRWPDIRLLLTSGHRRFSDADVPDDGRFVPKPYSSDTIVRYVETLLER